MHTQRRMHRRGRPHAPHTRTRTQPAQTGARSQDLGGRPTLRVTTPGPPPPRPHAHGRAAPRRDAATQGPPDRGRAPHALTWAARPPGLRAVPAESPPRARRKGGSERGGVAGGGGAGTALPEPPARVIKNPQTARGQNPARRRRRRPAWPAAWTRARAPERPRRGGWGASAEAGEGDDVGRGARPGPGRRGETWVGVRWARRGD